MGCDNSKDGREGPANGRKDRKAKKGGKKAVASASQRDRSSGEVTFDGFAPNAQAAPTARKGGAANGGTPGGKRGVKGAASAPSVSPPEPPVVAAPTWTPDANQPHIFVVAAGAEEAPLSGRSTAPSSTNTSQYFSRSMTATSAPLGSSQAQLSPSPLVAPSQRTVDTGPLVSDEASGRGALLLSQERCWKMLLFDAENARNALAGAARKATAPTLNALFTDDDEEEGGRRCSMRTEQTDGAAKVGKNTVVRTETFDTSAPPYSRRGVARHNTEHDLWVIVRNKIYDFTPLLGDHPGGVVPILSMAGQDATREFESNHASHMWNRLQKYFVAEVISSDRR